MRLKGLAKNTAHVVTLVSLSNLWMARKKLMAMMAEVRVQNLSHPRLEATWANTPNRTATPT